MYHDSVTGLPNFEDFLDFSKKMWASSPSNRFAILSTNIGSFRTINQVYGYAQGDNLLSHFAHELVRNSEHILSACRKKADHFLLLLDTAEIGLSETKNYIYKLFSDFNHSIGNLYPDIHLSFSIGVCLLSNGIFSLEKAIEHACFAQKTAMSFTDSASNIHIEFFQDELLGKDNFEYRIIPLFEDIMVSNHLIIYLQPKLDLETNLPIGAEALVRIMDSKGNLLKPATFLPVLEKYNLAYELDLLVTETILKVIKHWSQKGIEPLPISINLSDKDFSNPLFLQIYKELMDKYADYQNYLEFELSEHSISNNPDYMLQLIDTIHSYHCKVHLDGFGKNFLSLNTFGIPPVDAVKFDRSVICTCMRHEQNSHILKRLAEMFEDCKIPVICEGIENMVEEEFIKQCGIHYVQGYFYGRPVPLDLFEKKYLVYENRKSNIFV